MNYKNRNTDRLHACVATKDGWTLKLMTRWDRFYRIFFIRKLNIHTKAVFTPIDGNEWKAMMLLFTLRSVCIIHFSVTGNFFLWGGGGGGGGVGVSLFILSQCEYLGCIYTERKGMRFLWSLPLLSMNSTLNRWKPLESNVALFTRKAVFRPSESENLPWYLPFILWLFSLVLSSFLLSLDVNRP